MKTELKAGELNVEDKFTYKGEKYVVIGWDYTFTITRSVSDKTHVKYFPKEFIFGEDLTRLYRVNYG